MPIRITEAQARALVQPAESPPRKRTSRKAIDRLVATEAQVQAAILAMLARNGILAWRSNAGSAFVGEGDSRRRIALLPKDFPDVFGVLPDGRALFIEVKREGAEPRAGQHAMLAMLRQQGAVAFWVQSEIAAIEALRAAGVTLREGE